MGCLVGWLVGWVAGLKERNRIVGQRSYRAWASHEIWRRLLELCQGRRRRRTGERVVRHIDPCTWGEVPFPNKITFTMITSMRFTECTLIILPRSMYHWHRLLKVKLRTWCASACVAVRKATVGFIMSVCPSVRPPHGTTRLPLNGFSWNLSIFFDNLPRKLNFSFTYAKNNGFLTRKPVYIYGNTSPSSS